MSKILLCDNGSRKPGATLLLRQLAQRLSAECGQHVEAVSLQHADKIKPELIDNKPARTLPGFLQENLQHGERSFLILPLFFGYSRALTSYIPEQKALLEVEFGSFELSIADVLYPLPQGDERLPQILADHIINALTADPDVAQTAVLVDHGSPVPQVTAVRQRLAQEVQLIVGDRLQLSQACMERREGSEYDFNGELLEDWLTTQARAGKKSVIVSLMFLLPGRHAGNGGDIEEICQSVMQKYPGLNVVLTPLVAEHDRIINLLCDRLKKVLG